MIEASALDASALDAIANRIRAGGELEFSRDSILTMTAALKADKPDPHWWLFYGLIVAIGAILTLVWLVFM